MKASEQTIQQIERALNKIATKFPISNEVYRLTDIHLLVKSGSGELMAFDDDDNEITRCLIEEWVDKTNDSFNEDIAPLLSRSLQNMGDKLQQLAIFKPFSFTLINEEKETICELYLVDDDTIMLNKELLEGLEDDLDKFLHDLLNK